MHRLLLASIVASAVGLAPSAARADERPIAEQAFQEGRRLMAEGKLAEACAKFSAASQLSPTPGVRLNLSECLARLGKTASAWGKANEALTMAVRGGDSAAASLARDKMSSLAPKLSYLTLQIDKQAASGGVQLALDGENLPVALWGTALPVDAGDHEIIVRAPGRAPASMKKNIPADGLRETLGVPIPATQGPSPAAHGTSAEDAAPAGGWSRRSARTLALVSGGLGVVGLGVGTAAGLDAAAKKSDYQRHQSGGQCIDQACATSSQQALTAAGVSTIAFVAGGVLVAAAAVLWLTAPTRSAEAVAAAFVPVAGPGTLGAGVVGSF